MTNEAEIDAGNDRNQSIGIGASARRREDRRFVTGDGRYVDDVTPPGTLYAAFVRAATAHANIREIDTQAAFAVDGVVAVLTGADLAKDGIGDLPCESMPPAIVGPNWVRTPFPALVADRVRATGDAVAVVIAESRAAAKEGAEYVFVDYEDLPVVASLEAALVPDAPLVYETAAGNICFSAALGNADATAAAFERAAHVIELTTRQPRLIGAPMEPRAAIGSYDRREGRYTLVASTQNPHGLRRILSESVLRIPANRIRVVAYDVGGGFGTKGRLYPEDVVCLWAAHRLGRPVKWTSDRTESFLADFHGRDQMATGRIALDAEGHVLAIDVVTRHNVGCRLGPATGVSPFLTARMLVGPYAVAAAHVRVEGVFSNTRTTTSYRGAGRPEATFFIERALDKAAERLGLDKAEIRRRNLVRPEAMPFKTALVDTYDCGDFPAVLEKALGAADWNGFAGRRAASEAKGLLRGRGIASFVEVSAISNERMEIHFDPSGQATIIAGTFAHGQGHETIYTQLLADWLGLSPNDIHVIQGDTDQVSYGGGTYASRSATVGGSALRRAADAIIEQGKRIAAWMMKCDVARVSFVDGLFGQSDSNFSVTIIDVAKASYRMMGFPAELGVGLEAVGTYTASPQNYPNGVHVVEVEIDPALLTCRIVSYVAADDVGTVLNPLLLEGQLHGSAAQGIGQALSEAIVYDATGQLTTAAFLDYGVPRAHHMPPIASVMHPVPTETNPLGVKGGAEVGTIGAPPAIVQAVLDALAPLGVSDIQIPITPQAIFAAVALAAMRR